MSQWHEREARLSNEQGIHAYPAHVVAAVANCFESQIVIRYGEADFDAKATLMLLQLNREEITAKGTRLLVRAKGHKDASAAAAVVAAVLGSGFGED